MSIFDKLFNRPIIVHIYTNREELLLESRPNKSVKYYPNWWKELPLEYDLSEVGALGWSSTMKRCSGFTDQYQKGFIIPMWTDIAIAMDKKGSTGASWQSADMLTGLDNHSQKQRGTYLPETDFLHLKVNNPWRIVCKEDVQFMMVQPTWNFENPSDIIIPTGFLEFKYQHSAHINMFLKRKNTAQNLRFNQGEALVQLIPLTERPLKIKYHLIDDLEYNKMFNKSTRFTKRYQVRKEAKKCPFH
jgi:hypothetical protein